MMGILFTRQHLRFWSKNSMDYTPLIKKIRGIARKHYRQNSIGEVGFYSDFANSLHEFFEESLKEEYLFSFPFVSEKGEPKNPTKEYLISKWLSPEERKAIEDHLKEGERRLKTKECLSVTKVMIENLLEDEIQSLLIKSIGNEDANKKYKRLHKYKGEFQIIDLKEKLKDKQGIFTSDFEKIARNLNIQETDYEKLFNRFDTFVNLPTSDHFVYLIKPYANHKQFNVVLIFGLKVPLLANDFHFLRLLIYRYVSEVAIKNLEEAEKLKTKTSINYTVHSIKTMLGGLMDSPLKALEANYPTDSNVRMIRESKEIIEGLASILNLITKIEEGGTITLDDLEKSKLFSSSQIGFDIEQLFQKIESHRKYKGDSKKVVIERSNVEELIPILKYKTLYFSELLYFLYFLTLIENAFEHGKTDFETGSIILKLNYDSSKKEFIASNLSRNDTAPPKIESVQGNIKSINRLITVLGIGFIKFENQPDENNSNQNEFDFNFKTILKIHDYEK